MPIDARKWDRSNVHYSVPSAHVAVIGQTGLLTFNAQTLSHVSLFASLYSGARDCDLLPCDTERGRVTFSEAALKN